MNIKESFRYQKFLGDMMTSARISLTRRDNCITAVKKHMRSKAKAGAEDTEEIVDNGNFYKNDDVLDFMLFLVDERGKLTSAIGHAKAYLCFDIDAAIEANKFRHMAFQDIKRMLRNTPTQYIERGTAYTFNDEGNQVRYSYDVEVEEREAFDREKAKAVIRDLMSASDKVSSDIDSALINTRVDYTPPFNVSDTFEDAMEEFLKKGKII